MDNEKNPLIEWALHGKGETPNKEQLQALVLGLNESLAKTDNLIIEANRHITKAQALRNVIQQGLDKASAELNKHHG
jgi:hypothetical protein